MRRLRKYIKEAEININNLFESVDKKLKDYRIESLKLKYSKDYDDDIFYKYVQKMLYSIIDDFIELEIELSAAMYETEISIKEKGKEVYSNIYASNYLSEANQKYKMYYGIFDPYRAELNAAERYLLKDCKWIGGKNNAGI